MCRWRSATRPTHMPKRSKLYKLFFLTFNLSGEIMIDTVLRDMAPVALEAIEQVGIRAIASAQARAAASTASGNSLERTADSIEAMQAQIKHLTSLVAAQTAITANSSHINAKALSEANSGTNLVVFRAAASPISPESTRSNTNNNNSPLPSNSVGTNLVFIPAASPNSAGSTVTTSSTNNNILQLLDGTYQGDIVDGKPHGQGILIYITNNQLKHSRYTGQFQNGLFHGRGTLTRENGDCYDGEWEAGKRHGQGIATGTIWTYTTLAFRYVGSFANDQFHGQGTLTYNDGSGYVGPFVNDKRHGQGTETESSCCGQSQRSVTYDHGREVGCQCVLS